MTPPSAILHLTSPNGGGVDRYMRDLAKADGEVRSYFLHCGDRISVLEDPAQRRYFPIRAGALEEASGKALKDWFAQAGIAGLHVHAVSKPVRRTLDRIRAWGHYPYVVTLHDVSCVYPTAFAEDWVGLPPADASGQEPIGLMLDQAESVIVPSAFLAKLVSERYSGVAPRVIANGIERSPKTASITSIGVPREFADRPVFAVVGALGRHKGSEFLREVAHALGDSRALGVIIGYTDTRLTAGWEIPERLYVHGAFVDQELPELLQAYRVRVAYFPNRMPESFSYALSEVWAAKVPVLVHDTGALAERVRAGGGRVLPQAWTPKEVAAELERALSVPGGVVSHMLECSPNAGLFPHQPSTEEMRREVIALYRRFGIKGDQGTGAEPSLDALEPLLERNLNAFEFRKELLRLASDLEASEARFEALTQEQKRWSAQQEQAIAELRHWNDKLRHDLDMMRSDFTTVNAIRQGQEREIQALTRAKAGADAFAAEMEQTARNAQAWSDKLQRDCDALKENWARAEATGTALAVDVANLQQILREKDQTTRERIAMLEVYASAFLRLPRWLRRVMLGRNRNASA